MVPLNKSASCGIALKPCRSVSSPIVESSTPSMTIRPLHGSTIRKSACSKDDFPAPVLPTTPIYGVGRR